MSQDPPASSSSSTFKGGRRGFRGATSVKKVVFAESAASPSSSPKQGEREVVRRPRAKVFNRSQEDFTQEEHCDGLKDREVTVISPAPPAPPAPPVSYLPLMDSHPPCVSRLMREGTLQWNPEAPAWQPTSLDIGQWACGPLSTGQLPVAVWASTTWVEGPEFLGIGPLPSPGSGPMIPLFGPGPGGPANPGWLPIYNSGAWGASSC